MFNKEFVNKKLKDKENLAVLSGFETAIEKLKLMQESLEDQLYDENSTLDDLIIKMKLEVYEEVIDSLDVIYDDMVVRLMVEESGLIIENGKMYMVELVEGENNEIEIGKIEVM